LLTDLTPSSPQTESTEEGRAIMSDVSQYVTLFKSRNMARYRERKELDEGTGHIVTSGNSRPACSFGLMMEAVGSSEMVVTIY
jgi:hypothetical protein